MGCKMVNIVGFDMEKKIEASTVVLFKNDKRKEVFLVFRSDYPVWGTTGGGIDKGETPREAGIREAHEETGFKIKIARKVGQYFFERCGITYIAHIFEGRIVSGRFRPEFPGCRGCWFSVDNLPIDMTDRVKIRIADCIRHTSGQFDKEGWPLLLKNNLHLLVRHPLAVVRYIYKKHFEKR
jgi:8-oxo-dGTP pyrophosphatase MutT (NUDIX family)